MEFISWSKHSGPEVVYVFKLRPIWKAQKFIRIKIFWKIYILTNLTVTAPLCCFNITVSLLSIRIWNCRQFGPSSWLPFIQIEKWICSRNFKSWILSSCTVRYFKESIDSKAQLFEMSQPLKSNYFLLFFVNLSHSRLGYIWEFFAGFENILCNCLCNFMELKLIFKAWKCYFYFNSIKMLGESGMNDATNMYSESEIGGFHISM